MHDFFLTGEEGAIELTVKEKKMEKIKIKKIKQWEKKKNRREKNE